MEIGTSNRSSVGVMPENDINFNLMPAHDGIWGRGVGMAPVPASHIPMPYTIKRML